MQIWTIRKLLEWTSNYFKEKNIREARLEAEILLAGRWGKTGSIYMLIMMHRLIRMKGHLQGIY